MYKFLTIVVLALSISSASYAGDPTGDAYSACMSAATASYNAEYKTCLSRFGNPTSPNVPELMKCMDYARSNYTLAQFNCEKILP